MHDTLRDVLPIEFCLGEYHDTKAYKFRDVKVINSHKDDPWIGNEKKVKVWYELDNGYAVGWNENPSRGWSIPVVKIKK